MLVAKAKADHARRVRERERTQRDAGSAAQTTSAAARALRLRAEQRNIPDPPHVPLQDDWYMYDDKFAMRPEGYMDPMSEAVRRDREGIMRAGGYVVEEAWERAIRCAVAGLDLAPLVGLTPAVSSSTTTSGPSATTSVELPSGGGDVAMVTA